MSAYDRVLALGLSRPFYVLVVDAAGTILSDSRTSTPDTKAGIAGGLTLAQLRHDLGAGATEGTGLVTRDGAQFNISYQTVGEWTVIAVEALPPSTTCLRTGEKECR
jgi:hypothetical protein